LGIATTGADDSPTPPCNASGISGTGYETPKRQRLSDWGLRSLSPKYPKYPDYARRTDRIRAVSE
jgi:hypothetical protein